LNLRMKISHASLFWIPSTLIVAGALGGGCGAPPPFSIGMAGQSSEFLSFKHFLDADKIDDGSKHLCHVYTCCDVALASQDPTTHPPCDEGTPTHTPDGHTPDGLSQWMAQAQDNCDEVLVTFQGPQKSGGTVTELPSVSDFGDAFTAFQTT